MNRTRGLMETEIIKQNQTEIWELENTMTVMKKHNRELHQQTCLSRNFSF